MQRRIAVAAVSLLLACAAGCATAVEGQPQGEKGVNKVGKGKKPNDYTFPENNSGFAKGDMDQPDPVPGYNWVGWSGPTTRCAWVPAGLFDGLAAGAPYPAGHFCSFKMADGNTIQIAWGLDYGPSEYDAVAFTEPATIAGLQAKAYDLAANQKVYPGSCHVITSTRAMSNYGVLLWNEQKTPQDRAKSCQTAKTVAERIAKAMVPLAGGTVWPSTPQKPNPDVVANKACKVVDDIVTTFAMIEIEDENHVDGKNELGTTCTAKKNGRVSETVLTSGPGQGLARLPSAKGAEVKPIKIGQLDARQEVGRSWCAIAVELVPGRALRIQYSDEINDGDGCMYARSMVGVAVGRLLEKTK
jgi:hypothetical protein